MPTAAKPKKNAKSEPAAPVVGGLHGGHHLWPLLKAAERIGFMSWRSEVPEIADLLLVPAPERPAIVMGFFQLFIAPHTVDAPREAIEGAKQVLVGLVRVRKESAYMKAALVESQITELARWLREDPPISEGVWHSLIKVLDHSRSQGATIPGFLLPYADVGAIKGRWSRERAIDTYRPENPFDPAMG